MSAYLDWHAGMRVVCIDGLWDTNEPGETSPVEGGIYTVRTIEAHPEGVFIRLKEIVNPGGIRSGDVECQFAARQFRPVTKRPTSIAVFTALLNPSEDEIFREFEAAEFDYDENIAVPFR